MNPVSVLLITGGTGSFGNAVLRQVLTTHIREIRIFSRDEKKQHDMRQFYQDDRIKFYIGDVRDQSSVDKAMNGVEMVFHAAALKQVPSCEFFPMEALQTNVTGCYNVINSAVSRNVRKVVLLSTDKAVYPINAMGLTKALAEKMLVAKSRELQNNETILCTTRYGNVMGSRGSVIPLFINQIRNNQPLTVTDPMMKRFMMTLEEAVELVEFSFNEGENGDIFIKKTPACTLETLTRALMTLYNVKLPVHIIGTRHGEKRVETLITSEELVKAKDLGEFYRIPADNRDLNYSKYYFEGEQEVNALMDYTSESTHQLNINETCDLLLKLPLIRKDILNESISDHYEP
ncbi:MAG: NAD-dependent epimerase/dehydratase family protein [Bacteroidetes bacterium]|nr:NAD-dependent epimerase/dehydratase family protein [Bacteroidota bacterium]